MQRDENDRERDYDTENEPVENFDPGEAETEFTGPPTRSKSAARAAGSTAGKRAGNKTATARPGQRSASARGKRPPKRPSRAGR